MRYWKSKKWSQGKVVELLQMVVSQTLRAVYIKTIVCPLNVYNEFGMVAVTKQPLLLRYFRVVPEDLNS